MKSYSLFIKTIALTLAISFTVTSTLAYSDGYSPLIPTHREATSHLRPERFVNSAELPKVFKEFLDQNSFPIPEYFKPRTLESPASSARSEAREHIGEETWKLFAKLADSMKPLWERYQTNQPLSKDEARGIKMEVDHLFQTFWQISRMQLPSRNTAVFQESFEARKKQLFTLQQWANRPFRNDLILTFILSAAAGALIAGIPVYLITNGDMGATNLALKLGTAGGPLIAVILSLLKRSSHERKNFPEETEQNKTFPESRSEARERTGEKTWKKLDELGRGITPIWNRYKNGPPVSKAEALKIHQEIDRLMAMLYEISKMSEPARNRAVFQKSYRERDKQLARLHIWSLFRNSLFSTASSAFLGASVFGSGTYFFIHENIIAISIAAFFGMGFGVLMRGAYGVFRYSKLYPEEKSEKDESAPNPRSEARTEEYQIEPRSIREIADSAENRLQGKTLGQDGAELGKRASTFFEVFTKSEKLGFNYRRYRFQFHEKRPYLTASFVDLTGKNGPVSYQDTIFFTITPTQFSVIFTKQHENSFEYEGPSLLDMAIRADNNHPVIIIKDALTDALKHAPQAVQEAIVDSNLFMHKHFVLNGHRELFLDLHITRLPLVSIETHDGLRLFKIRGEQTFGAATNKELFRKLSKLKNHKTTLGWGVNKLEAIDQTTGDWILLDVSEDVTILTLKLERVLTNSRSEARSITKEIEDLVPRLVRSYIMSYPKQFVTESPAVGQLVQKIQTLLADETIQEAELPVWAKDLDKLRILAERLHQTISQLGKKENYKFLEQEIFELMLTIDPSLNPADIKKRVRIKKRPEPKGGPKTYEIDFPHQLVRSQDLLLIEALAYASRNEEIPREKERLTPKDASYHGEVNFATVYQKDAEGKKLPNKRSVFYTASSHYARTEGEVVPIIRKTGDWEYSVGLEVPSKINPKFRYIIASYVFIKNGEVLTGKPVPSNLEVNGTMKADEIPFSTFPVVRELIYAITHGNLPEHLWELREEDLTPETGGGFFVSDHISFWKENVRLGKQGYQNPILKFQKVRKQDGAEVWTASLWTRALTEEQGIGLPTKIIRPEIPYNSIILLDNGNLTKKIPFPDGRVGFTHVQGDIPKVHRALRADPIKSAWNVYWLANGGPFIPTDDIIVPDVGRDTYLFNFRDKTINIRIGAEFKSETIRSWVKFPGVTADARGVRYHLHYKDPETGEEKTADRYFILYQNQKFQEPQEIDPKDIKQSLFTTPEEIIPVEKKPDTSIATFHPSLTMDERLNLIRELRNVWEEMEKLDREWNEISARKKGTKQNDWAKLLRKYEDLWKLGDDLSIVERTGNFHGREYLKPRLSFSKQSHFEKIHSGEQSQDEFHRLISKVIRNEATETDWNRLESQFGMRETADGRSQFKGILLPATKMPHYANFFLAAQEENHRLALPGYEEESVLISVRREIKNGESYLRFRAYSPKRLYEPYESFYYDYKSGKYIDSRQEWQEWFSGKTKLGVPGDILSVPISNSGNATLFHSFTKKDGTVIYGQIFMGLKLYEEIDPEGFYPFNSRGVGKRFFFQAQEKNEKKLVSIYGSAETTDNNFLGTSRWLADGDLESKMKEGQEGWVGFEHAHGGILDEMLQDENETKQRNAVSRWVSHEELNYREITIPSVVGARNKAPLPPPIGQSQSNAKLALTHGEYGQPIAWRNATETYSDERGLDLYFDGKLHQRGFYSDEKPLGINALLETARRFQNVREGKKEAPLLLYIPGSWKMSEALELVDAGYKTGEKRNVIATAFSEIKKLKIPFDSAWVEFGSITENGKNFPALYFTALEKENKKAILALRVVEVGTNQFRYDQYPSGQDVSRIVIPRMVSRGYYRAMNDMAYPHIIAERIQNIQREIEIENKSLDGLPGIEHFADTPLIQQLIEANRLFQNHTNWAEIYFYFSSDDFKEHLAKQAQAILEIPEMDTNTFLARDEILSFIEAYVKHPFVSKLLGQETWRLKPIDSILDFLNQIRSHQNISDQKQLKNAILSIAHDIASLKDGFPEVQIGTVKAPRISETPSGSDEQIEAERPKRERPVMTTEINLQPEVVTPKPEIQEIPVTTIPENPPTIATWSEAFRKLDAELFYTLPRNYSERLERLGQMREAYEHLVGELVNKRVPLHESEVFENQHFAEEWNSVRKSVSKKDFASRGRSAGFLIWRPIGYDWRRTMHVELLNARAAKDKVQTTVTKIQEQHPEMEYFWIEMGPAFLATGHPHPALYIVGINSRTGTTSQVHRFIETKSELFDKEEVVSPESLDFSNIIREVMHERGYELPGEENELASIIKDRLDLIDYTIDGEQQVALIDDLLSNPAESMNNPELNAALSKVFHLDLLSHLAQARKASGLKNGPSLLEIPFLIRSTNLDQVFAFAAKIHRGPNLPSREDALDFLRTLGSSHELASFLGNQRFRFEPFDRIYYKLERSDETPEKILEWVKFVAGKVYEVRQGPYAVERKITVKKKVPKKEPSDITTIEAVVEPTVQEPEIVTPVTTKKVPAPKEIKPVAPTKTWEEQKLEDMGLAYANPAQALKLVQTYQERSAALIAQNDNQAGDLLDHINDLLSEIYTNRSLLTPRELVDFHYSYGVGLEQVGVKDDSVVNEYEQALEALGDHEPLYQEKIVNKLVDLGSDHPWLIPIQIRALKREYQQPLHHQDKLGIERRILALDPDDQDVPKWRAQRQIEHEIETLISGIRNADLINEHNRQFYHQRVRNIRAMILEYFQVFGDYPTHHPLWKKFDSLQATFQARDIELRLEKLAEFVDDISDLSEQPFERVALLISQADKLSRQDKQRLNTSLARIRAVYERKKPHPVNQEPAKAETLKEAPKIQPKMESPKVEKPVPTAVILNVDLGEESREAGVVLLLINNVHQKNMGHFLGIIRGLLEAIQNQASHEITRKGDAFIKEYATLASKNNFMPGKALQELLTQTNAIYQRAQSKISHARSEVRNPTDKQIIFYSQLTQEQKTAALYRLIIASQNAFKQKAPQTVRGMRQAIDPMWNGRQNGRYQDALIFFKENKPVGTYEFRLDETKKIGWGLGIYMAENSRLNGDANLLFDTLMSTLRSQGIEKFYSGFPNSQFEGSGRIKKTLRAQKFSKHVVTRYNNAVEDYQISKDGFILHYAINLTKLPEQVLNAENIRNNYQQFRTNIREMDSWLAEALDLAGKAFENGDFKRALWHIETAIDLSEKNPHRNDPSNGSNISYQKIAHDLKPFQKALGEMTGHKERFVLGNNVDDLLLTMTLLKEWFERIITKQLTAEELELAENGEAWITFDHPSFPDQQKAKKWASVRIGTFSINLKPTQFPPRAFRILLSDLKDEKFDQTRDLMGNLLSRSEARAKKQKKPEESKQEEVPKSDNSFYGLTIHSFRYDKYNIDYQVYNQPEKSDWPKIHERVRFRLEAVLSSVSANNYAVFRGAGMQPFVKPFTLAPDNKLWIFFWKSTSQTAYEFAVIQSEKEPAQPQKNFKTDDPILDHALIKGEMRTQTTDSYRSGGPSKRSEVRSPAESQENKPRTFKFRASHPALAMELEDFIHVTGIQASQIIQVFTGNHVELTNGQEPSELEFADLALTDGQEVTVTYQPIPLPPKEPKTIRSEARAKTRTPFFEGILKKAQETVKDGIQYVLLRTLFLFYLVGSEIPDFNFLRVIALKTALRLLFSFAQFETSIQAKGIDKKTAQETIHEIREKALVIKNGKKITNYEEFLDYIFRDSWVSTWREVWLTKANAEWNKSKQERNALREMQLLYFAIDNDPIRMPDSNEDTVLTESQMIYRKLVKIFPKAIKRMFQSEGLPVPQVNIVRIKNKNGGKPMRGYLIGKGPLNVVLHGMTTTKEQQMQLVYVKKLVAQGQAVLLIDTPGHGENQSKPLTPETINQFWESIFEHLEEAKKNKSGVESRVDANQIGLYGFSFGGNMVVRAWLNKKFRDRIKVSIAVNAPIHESFDDPRKMKTWLDHGNLYYRNIFGTESREEQEKALRALQISEEEFDSIPDKNRMMFSFGGKGDRLIASNDEVRWLRERYREADVHPEQFVIQYPSEGHYYLDKKEEVFTRMAEFVKRFFSAKEAIQVLKADVHPLVKTRVHGIITKINHAQFEIAGEDINAAISMLQKRRYQLYDFVKRKQPKAFTEKIAPNAEGNVRNIKNRILEKIHEEIDFVRETIVLLNLANDIMFPHQAPEEPRSYMELATPLRFFGEIIFPLMKRLLVRQTLTGIEHIPDDGPAVLVANHFTLQDGLYAAVSVAKLTEQLRLQRKRSRMRFLVVVARPTDLGGVQQYLIRRGAALEIKEGLTPKTIQNYLKAGYTLLVFPTGVAAKEGQAQTMLENWKSSIFNIVAQLGIRKVIPVAISAEHHPHETPRNWSAVKKEIRKILSGEGRLFPFFDHHIEILEPIETTGKTPEEVTLAAKNAIGKALDQKTINGEVFHYTPFEKLSVKETSARPSAPQEPITVDYENLNDLAAAFKTLKTVLGTPATLVHTGPQIGIQEIAVSRNLFWRSAVPNDMRNWALTLFQNGEINRYIYISPNPEAPLVIVRKTPAGTLEKTEITNEEEKNKILAEIKNENIVPIAESEKGKIQNQKFLSENGLQPVFNIHGTLGLAQTAANVIKAAYVDYNIKRNQTEERAKPIFEKADWNHRIEDDLEDINLYSKTLDEAGEKLKHILGNRIKDEAFWKTVRKFYPLKTEYDDDLAVTFFYSTMRRNDIPVEYDDDGINKTWTKTPEKIYRTYYKPKNTRGKQPGTEEEANNIVPLIEIILRDAEFNAQYENPKRDMENAAKSLLRKLKKQTDYTNFEKIEIIKHGFYRNKAVYLMGAIRQGGLLIPIAIPIFNEEHGLKIGEVQVGEEEVSNLISYARSSFKVVTKGIYRELAAYLHGLMPNRSIADIYSAIGFEHPAKIEFRKDFREFLRTHDEQFEFSEGLRGKVMEVIDFPSFPYVFKFIRDKSTKYEDAEEMRKRVMEQYQRVIRMDRAGRKMGFMTFYNLKAVPKKYFPPHILEALLTKSSKSVVLAGDEVLFKQVYVKRKGTPLNVYLEDPNIPVEKKKKVVIDFGYALKDLAAAGEFDIDYSTYNFMVTRNGKVVSYDYDSNDSITNWTFSHKPQPKTDWEEMMDESEWLVTGHKEIYPEELMNFLAIPSEYQEAFLSRHADLLTPEYWNKIKNQHLQNQVPDLSRSALYKSSPSSRSEARQIDSAWHLFSQNPAKEPEVGTPAEGSVRSWGKYTELIIVIHDKLVRQVLKEVKIIAPEGGETRIAIGEEPVVDNHDAINNALAKLKSSGNPNFDYKWILTPNGPRDQTLEIRPITRSEARSRNKTPRSVNSNEKKIMEQIGERTIEQFNGQEARRRRSVMKRPASNNRSELRIHANPQATNLSFNQLESSTVIEAKLERDFDESLNRYISSIPRATEATRSMLQKFLDIEPSNQASSSNVLVFLPSASNNPEFRSLVDNLGEGNQLAVFARTRSETRVLEKMLQGIPKSKWPKMIQTTQDLVKTFPGALKLIFIGLSSDQDLADYLKKQLRDLIAKGVIQVESRIVSSFDGVLGVINDFAVDLQKKMAFLEAA